MKVKEFIEQEYNLIKKDQLLFIYFYFVFYELLIKVMIDCGVICLVYEIVENFNGSFLFLVFMFEVVGCMVIQEGVKFLEKLLGGFGVLLGGVLGVELGCVFILGGGVVGI